MEYNKSLHDSNLSSALQYPEIIVNFKVTEEPQYDPAEQHIIPPHECLLWGLQ